MALRAIMLGAGALAAGLSALRDPQMRASAVLTLSTSTPAISRIRLALFILATFTISPSTRP